MNETLNETFGKRWRLVLTVGILNALVGTMVFLPIFKGDTLIFIVGVMILLSAILAAVYTFAPGNRGDKINGILAIVVRLVTAFLLFSNPLDRNITFTTLLAMYFGVDGALVVAEAVRLKKANSEYMPLMILGGASVFCSLLLWTVMTGSLYATVSTLLAVTFWVRAVVLLRVGFKLKGLQQSAAGSAPAGPVEEPPGQGV